MSRYFCSIDDFLAPPLARIPSQIDRASSIYELAKILGRDLKNTFNDVQFLAQAGLVELTKTKNGRERTTPTVKYDKILLEIQV